MNKKITLENNYEILKKSVLDRLKNIYGENVPKVINERLQHELNYIEYYHPAYIFLLAQTIVQEAENMGYITGTRGSVSASFVSYLLGITEINPLVPHYICSKCKHIEFMENEFCGYDLKDKLCPICGEKLYKDGFYIPYETFFGENGNRCPDIIINVSSEIKNKLEHTMNSFCQQLFKTKNDFEINNKNNSENINFIDKNAFLTNKKNDIFQLKADGCSISILLHDDMTKLKELQNLTGINPKTIPFNDKKTWDLFNSCDLKGVSECDTEFITKMYENKTPYCIDDLIRYSGLAHGVGTWTDNVEALINNHKLNELVSSRDDIMIYLMKKGYDRKEAYRISERVYKGKQLTEEQSERILNNNIPLWFIESCNKIKYIFPRAHYAAYSLMAYRLAYFKANYEDEFERVMTIHVST